MIWFLGAFACINLIAVVFALLLFKGGYRIPDDPPHPLTGKGALVHVSPASVLEDGRVRFNFPELEDGIYRWAIAKDDAAEHGYVAVVIYAPDEEPEEQDKTLTFQWLEIREQRIVGAWS